MVVTSQETALEILRRGENAFVTGMAGTGKSTLIKAFVESAPQPVTVTASTGVAALNVRGLTLHSFCAMGLGPNPGQSHDDFIRFLESRPAFNRAEWRIRAVHTLIIDEVSMLDGKTFNFVDALFRHVRRDERPFGGAQVIVVGDFLQLSPVKKSDQANYDWAFDSRAWKEASFINIYLQKIWRQDDPDFIGCLNGFREGRLLPKSERLLRGRAIDFPDDNIPRLLTHNSMVDKWNRQMLDLLPGEDVVIPAIVRGPESQQDFLRRNLITPELLVLREGARVMMTANASDNDGTRLFVNGQMATVEKIETKYGPRLQVALDHGETLWVDRQTWQYDWQDSTSAAFIQFPLKPAYAMTIHKSQGLTLDQAFIDIRAAREPGQAYVALSRVRSIEGVWLKAWFSGYMVSQKALAFYQSLA